MSEDQFLWSPSGDFMGKIDHSLLLATIGQRGILLTSIFDMIPFGLEVLECVRNSQNIIIDFRYIYQNKFAQEVNGKGNLVTKTLSNVYAAVPARSIIDRLVKVVETGEANETILPIDSAAGQIWVLCCSQKLSDGVVTSHIDITAQKLAEGKVNNTLQFFEQISGTIPDMMYVFDRVDRDILFFNEHGIDILGKDKEFIYKKGIDLFLTIIHADDLESYKAHLEECSKLSARDVKELELRIKIKGEDYRWFWIRETAFKSDKNGNALQILGIARDIQMQKMARNALIKNNQELDSQNTELRHFNSITGNDFKENLKKVYTSLEFIASNDARHLSNEGRANIRRTQSAIQKMRLLTDDISAYSGLFELEPDFSMVNPNEIIKNVLIKLREPIRRTGANIEITHFPKMYADSFMMTSLLFNLVDNAIKFRKQILPPHIRIKYVQADEINFDERAIKDTPHGIVSVSDNGIGLRDTEAEKIFDLFYRKEDESKYKGLGIGLAICKRIMSIHRGFITAEGTPAAGSTFSCYFPLHQLL